MSANLTVKSDSNITFTRRYLDSNRVTFEYHTGRSNNTFDTSEGQEITKGLNQLAKQFDLTFLYGTAPQDYTLSRDPYPSNGSLLSLLATEVLPVALSVNNTRASIPRLIFVPTGTLRYDIFKGPFDKNDQFTILPRTNAFMFVSNVTLNIAQQVFTQINGDSGTASRREFINQQDTDWYGRGFVDRIYNAWLRDMWVRLEGQEGKRNTQDLTPGLVTKDSCPGVGDDIPHTPLPFFDTPDYAASDPPVDVNPDVPIIDFVFADFVQDMVLSTLNSVQNTTTYTDTDVGLYSPLLLKDVLGVYAEQAWN